AGGAGSPIRQMLIKTEGGLQPGHRPQKPFTLFRKNRINHSCVARCAVQDPPFRGENLLSGSDYGRDRRFRAQSRLGSGDVFTSRQEGFTMHLGDMASDSRSGLKMGESFLWKRVFSFMSWHPPNHPQDSSFPC